MRYWIIIILTITTWSTCLGQELAIIRDTVNNFEIGVPIGWRYGVPEDNSVTFLALRKKQNDLDVPRENFNLNILYRDEVDLNKSFSQYLESVGKAEGFRILDQGERKIKNREYKYLIETHKNRISKEEMCNYVLFTNKNGEILILTIVTTSENFEKFKTLFDSIALSLNY
jgi:hypothetical protein